MRIRERLRELIGPVWVVPPPPPHPSRVAALEARVQELEDRWQALIHWMESQPQAPKATAHQNRDGAQPLGQV